MHGLGDGHRGSGRVASSRRCLWHGRPSPAVGLRPPGGRHRDRRPQLVGRRLLTVSEEILLRTERQRSQLQISRPCCVAARSSSPGPERSSRSRACQYSVRATSGGKPAVRSSRAAGVYWAVLLEDAGTDDRPARQAHTAPPHRRLWARIREMSRIRPHQTGRRNSVTDVPKTARGRPSSPRGDAGAAGAHGLPVPRRSCLGASGRAGRDDPHPKNDSHPKLATNAPASPASRGVTPTSRRRPHRDGRAWRGVSRASALRDLHDRSALLIGVLTHAPASTS
jgi:hypothetical protein